MKDIRYYLTVEVNGEEVYSSSYPDTTMLQEDGLRKAEYAVEKFLEEENEDE